MVDTKFSARRIIKLYFNTWIFSSSLGVFTLLLGFHPQLKYVIAGFIPFISKNLWFVSTYIGLLLLSPWLNKLLELPKTSLLKLNIVLCFLISGFATIWAFKPMEDRWLATLIYFSFAYLFIGYYKKYHNKQCKNKERILMLGVLLYITIVYTPLITKYFVKNDALCNAIDLICSNYLGDYRTIPNMFISMSIFNYFRFLKMDYNKYINHIASGAFTTYVVHQTQSFYPILWHDIFQCDNFYVNYDYPVVYAMIVTIIVYTMCLALEMPRKKVIEPYILSRKLIHVIEERIDHFYSKV